jgi:Flp pilus assembly protein TadG
MDDAPDNRTAMDRRWAASSVRASSNGHPEGTTRLLGDECVAVPGASFRRWLPVLRASDERGSHVVEFVLIFPILLALVFGLITAGIAFSNKLSTTNGAREAARYAATLPDDASWFTNVISTAETSSSGDIDTEKADHSVCVSRTIDGSTWESMERVGGTATAGVAACFADTRDDPRVQVQVQRPGEVDAIFYQFDVTLGGQAVARWEAAP